MTRFFKVSLSIVALLLVSLMVFTGCGKADEALTKAEAAEKAVAEATASLEAALADKADATKLAAEVEALTQAIRNAETIAEEGDATLNAAIEAAKKTLTDNTEEIIATIESSIIVLQNEKADQAKVDEAVASLKATVEQIAEATGAYIKIQDYVQFSTTAAYYALDLENLWNSIKGTGLYAGYQDKLEYEYQVAKIAIYRAPNMETIEDVYARFEAVVKACNALPDAIYNTILAYENKDTSCQYSSADALYEYVYGAYSSEETTDAERLAIADYIVITTETDEKVIGETNLVVRALELWRAELTVAMNSQASVYVVYPEHEDYDDQAAIAAVRANITKFNGETGVAYCTANFADKEVAEFVASAEFVNVENMVAVLATAKADAEKVAEISAEYIAWLASTVVNRPLEVALTQTDIDYINNWSTAYKNWNTKYIEQFQIQNYQNATDAATRKAENQKLVEATANDMADLIDQLEVLAGDYLDDANEMFIDKFVENFYDTLDEDGNDIMGAYDESKVKLFSRDLLNEIWTGVLAWEKIYTLNLDGICGVEDYEPNKLISEIITARDYYENVVAKNALDAWKLLPHAAMNTLIGNYTTEESTLTIYDTTALTVKAWFDTYVGDVEWSDFALGDGDDLKVTKEYYNNVLAVEAARQELIEAQAALNEALAEKINALATATYAGYSDKIDAAQLALNAYAESAYDANNSTCEPGETVTINAKYELIPADDSQDKIDAAKTRLETLKQLDEDVTAAKAELNTMTGNLNEEYPYFDDVNTGDAEGDVLPTVEDYKNAYTKLENAVNAFVAENDKVNDPATDRTGMTEQDTDKLIADAKAIIAEEERLDAIYAAEKAVKDAQTALENLELNADLPYFDETAEEEGDVTAEAYEQAKENLEAALDAYEQYADEEEYNSELVDSAEESVAEAELNLSKSATFADFLAHYNKVKADILADTDNVNQSAALTGLDDIREEYDGIVEAYGDDVTDEQIAADLLKYEQFTDLLYIEYGIARSETTEQA